MGLRAGHSKPPVCSQIRGTQAWHPICTRAYYNISNWLKSTPFSTRSSTICPLIHTTESDQKAIEHMFSTKFLSRLWKTADRRSGCFAYAEVYMRARRKYTVRPD